MQGILFLDNDECNDGSHNCEQHCVNTPGSFSCECAFGYNLTSDGQTCQQGNDKTVKKLANITYNENN